ncbi:MAG TPA: mechanosensitive ion channel domain-containing protein, partial [Chitinophagaceae bacterium]|nr:mechanosensitive ion channel domain-containing protein [Chitinophagaceae bacterium]
IFIFLPAHAQDAYYKEHGPNYSPYHAMFTHYHYLTGDDYDPNISAKAFKDGSISNRSKLAIKLKQVLDGKGLRIDFDEVPKDPKYLDTTTQTSIYKPFQRQNDIYLEKSNGKWYYSQATVEAIPALHKEIYPLGSDIWVNIVPDKLHTQIFVLNTWQWFGILVIIVLAFCVYRLLAIPGNMIIMQMAKKHVEWDESNLQLSKKTARTISLLVTIIVVSKLVPTLQFGSKTSQFIVFALNVMAITFSVILVWRLVDIVMLYISRRRGVDGMIMEQQHLSIIRKTIKIFLIITGLILILSMMGTNITALLAGLSVGGLAVALAAQDTIKNMFGALMILVDKPFKAGDLIQSEGINGFVEN